MYLYVKQFSNPSKQEKINELVVTSNKLTDNFAGLITSGLGPDVARGPPVVPRWPILCYLSLLYNYNISDPRSQVEINL
jgi:hypothetical protein